MLRPCATGLGGKAPRALRACCPHMVYRGMPQCSHALPYSGCQPLQPGLHEVAQPSTHTASAANVSTNQSAELTGTDVEDSSSAACTPSCASWPLRSVLCRAAGGSFTCIRNCPYKHRLRKYSGLLRAGGTYRLQSTEVSGALAANSSSSRQAMGHVRWWDGQALSAYTPCKRQRCQCTGHAEAYLRAGGV